MKKKIIVILVLICTLICTGNVNAKSCNGSKQHIVYTNVKSNKLGDVKLNNTRDSINFTTNFKKPGDKFIFTVDIVNNSKIDYKVSTIKKTKLTDSKQRYLAYDVTYKNGNKIKKNDILRHNSKKTIKVIVEFKYDITNEDFERAVQDGSVDLSFDINFVER